MLLEIGKLFLLLGGIALLAPHGVLVAASAVGVAFGFNAIVGVFLVAREGPSAWRLFVSFAQPLAACAVMAAAVLGARQGLDAAGITTPAVHLVVGIVVGVIVYPVAALSLCRETSRDLLRLAREVVSRRRGGGDE
jgi:peptidoglycan biosynthesis protein MviN/MurJ (putative lipid II flippase)